MCKHRKQSALFQIALRFGVQQHKKTKFRDHQKRKARDHIILQGGGFDNSRAIEAKTVKENPFQINF